MRSKEEHKRRGVSYWLVHFVTTPSILSKTLTLNPTHNLGNTTHNLGITGNFERL